MRAVLILLHDVVLVKDCTFLLALLTICSSCFSSTTSVHSLDLATRKFTDKIVISCDATSFFLSLCVYCVQVLFDKSSLFYCFISKQRQMFAVFLFESCFLVVKHNKNKLVDRTFAQIAWHSTITWIEQYS